MSTTDAATGVGNRPDADTTSIGNGPDANAEGVGNRTDADATSVGIADLDEAALHWQEHGWVLVDGLVPTADIDHAVEDLWDLYPHPDEFHGGDAAHRSRFVGSSHDQGHKFGKAGDDGPAFRAEQFLGHIMFPYESLRLNRLQVHRNVVHFARRAMGLEDIRIYQARTWASTRV